MKTKLPITLFILILTSTLPLRIIGQVKANLHKLDSIIQKGVSLFDMPGMAVGIMKDGKVVFNKAYGYRDTQTKEKVDSQTLFGIASCTKAFTAACMAMLVDEGKLNWTEKVIDYYPEFRMYDPYVTSEMEIQDLLCHRSGLQTFDGDLLWYGTDYSREEVVRRIQYRENSYSFRSRFGYQNVMFIAAGEVIKRVSGISWDAFVKTRIFEPLGMSSSTTTNRNFTKEMNVALPHLDGNPMEFINYDNSGPAAAINTSVDDLMKWVGLLLAKGKIGDTSLFSERQYYNMVNVHTPLNAGKAETPGETHFYGYGMGWFLYDDQGMKVINHGGGLPGFHSKVVLVPEDSLGFVILANQLSGLVEALNKEILDAFLIGEEKDWIQRYYDGQKKREKADEEKAKKLEAERITGTNPTLNLEKYTGTYVDKMYGPAEINLEDGQLKLIMVPTKQLFHGDLEHWQYDTFRTKLADPYLNPGYITFQINDKAEAESFTIDLESQDFHFEKLKFIRVAN